MQRGFPNSSTPMAGIGGGSGPSPTSDFAFVNVATLGVDITGTRDSSTAIQNAFNSLAGTGQAAWFPAGTVKVAAPVTRPNGLIVWCDPAATFVGAIAGSTVADSMFVARVPQDVGAPTLVATGAVALGATQFGLADATKITVGEPFSVLMASGIIVYYVAEALNEGTVTVDRPVQWPIVAGDVVHQVDELPPTDFWYCNGASFTGECVLFFYGAGWYGRISEPSFSAVTGTAADALCGFHNGSLGCVIDGWSADCEGAVDIFNCYVGFVGAEACTGYGGVGKNGGPACSGIKLDDCRGCSWRGDFQVSGAAIGGLVSTDSGVTTDASQGCGFYDGTFIANGINISVGSGSTETTVQGCSCLAATGAANVQANGGGGATGLRILSTAIVGSAGVGFENASGFLDVELFGCDIASSTSRDVFNAGVTNMVGGSIRSFESVSWFNATAAGVRSSIVGTRLAHLAGGSATGVIENDGGELVVRDCTVTGAVNGDVMVWNTGGTDTPVTILEATDLAPSGGATGTFGMYLPSGTMRAGHRVSADTCATPFDVAGGALNRGTVNSNGITPSAVSFPDLKTTDTVKLIPTVAGSSGAVLTRTPGTGFSIAALAGDANPYLWEVS